MKKNILMHVDKQGEEHDYNHILALLRFEDDDNYVLKNVIVNEKFNIDIYLGKEVRFPYRSQGNYHVLFRSESGPFFYKGFDGHKGNVYYDSNEIMEGLVDYLNTKDMKMTFSFDYNLLGVIEEYFNSLIEGTKEKSPFEMD